MKSVLTEEEYNRTKLIVDDFGKPGGTGEMLQENLRKVAESKDNWVNTMYCSLGSNLTQLPVSHDIFCNTGSSNVSMSCMLSNPKQKYIILGYYTEI